ncbi:mannosyl transferase [Colletotrichum incanum]|uniref:Mannosyl transferase n=1 Tax=Colletotrichum incanum TaxID=1573173 RepID=A0A167CTJ2_COLIC|nr:mannosyl transferase [Colletotrichum incanum]
MVLLTSSPLSSEGWKLLIGLFVLFSAGILSRSFSTLRRKKGATFSHKPVTRSHGKPTNDSYSWQMPIPNPYPNWSIDKTKPLPYRAFRYGPKYNVTMGLRSIQPEEWIELDNHFPKFHTDKTNRIQERGEKCFGADPEAYPAAMELLEELVQYLPARYPTLFKRTAVGIDNKWSGESFNIIETPLKEDPMAIAAKLVQDDLAIMIERPDGKYYFLAGAILLAGFWRLGDKFGMSLEEIHTSGDVPHYKEKLHNGMASFFKRLRCDQIYSRNNYFIQVDDSLPWSWSIGEEDSPVVSWSTAEKDRAIEHHYFRSERQSLRRLPKTKAIVFTIRTYFHPITELVSENYVPGRLASAIRSWDEKVANYKGREKYETVLLEYLDNEHQKQLDQGLNLENEDEVRRYPW